MFPSRLDTWGNTTEPGPRTQDLVQRFEGTVTMRWIDSPPSNRRPGRFEFQPRSDVGLVTRSRPPRRRRPVAKPARRRRPACAGGPSSSCRESPQRPRLFRGRPRHETVPARMRARRSPRIHTDRKAGTRPRAARRTPGSTGRHGRPRHAAPGSHRHSRSRPADGPVRETVPGNEFSVAPTHGFPMPTSPRSPCPPASSIGLG